MRFPRQCSISKSSLNESSTCSLHSGHGDFATWSLGLGSSTSSTSGDPIEVKLDRDGERDVRPNGDSSILERVEASVLSCPELSWKPRARRNEGPPDEGTSAWDELGWDSLSMSIPRAFLNGAFSGDLGFTDDCPFACLNPPVQGSC